MARWRGIFGRKGKREGEPDAAPPGSGDAGTDPVTALYPTAAAPGTPAGESDEARGEANDTYSTDDWQRVADPREEDEERSGGDPSVEPKPDGDDPDPSIGAAPNRVRVAEPFDPDTGTAEWAPPSPVAGRRAERPATEPEDDAEPEPVDGPEGSAEPASAAARPVDEVESDDDAEPLVDPGTEPDTGERIQAAANEAAQVAEIRSHDEIVALEESLSRAREQAKVEADALNDRLAAAESRAAAAEQESARLSSELEQVETRAREAATRWLRGQVAKLRADFDQRVSDEVDRVRADPGTATTAEPTAGDAETSETGTGAGADAGPSSEPGSERADADVDRLRRELDEFREADEARIAEARAAGRAEAEGASADDRRSELEAARAAGRAELQGEIDASADSHRAELEQRALAAAEAGTAERIARAEADAEERIRAEVAVARRAAEERFAEKLAERERELQTEREAKATAIEESNERLSQIESQAVQAAQRVSEAERDLGEEKLRLQKESAAQLEIATSQANALAAKDAAERHRDREEELSDAIAAAEQAKRDVEAKVAEAETRAERAEGRTRAVEEEAAATISEVRQAAADWLRQQTKDG